MNHTCGSCRGSGARPAIWTGDGSPPGPSGGKFVSAVLVTPGRPRAAFWIPVYKAVKAAGLRARVGGGEMKNVTSPPGSNPGFTARSCHRLLISSPAPTTRITAKAISPATSTARSRCRSHAMPAPPVPSFNVSVKLGRAARRAGSSPAAIALRIVTPRANVRTQPSTRTVSRRGSTEGAARLSNAIAQRASHTCEHDALGEELLYDPPSSRSQGRTDGELPAACVGASEGQVRHVDTRDQQNEADCGDEHEQLRPSVAEESFAQGHAAQLGPCLLQ